MNIGISWGRLGRIVLATASAALLGGGTAYAKDESLCRNGFICASYPEGVLRAMTDAGLTAKLSVDGQGDPSIEGEADGYRFDVFFYGCEAQKQCDSLQFQVSFAAAPENTAELANQWNASKRFLQAAVRPNGVLAFSYDLTTVGGIGGDNFADVLLWWQVMLDEIAGFFDTKLKKPGEGVEPAPAEPVAARTS